MTRKRRWGRVGVFALFAATVLVYHATTTTLLDWGGGLFNVYVMCMATVNAVLAIAGSVWFAKSVVPA